MQLNLKSLVTHIYYCNIKLSCLESKEYILQVKNSIEEIKKTLRRDTDFRETFSSRMENLDTSLEGVRSLTETLTQAIDEINQKLTYLEADSAEQKMHSRELMARQDTLEQRENAIEKQLQNLQMSTHAVEETVDFNQGLFALFLFHLLQISKLVVN